MRDNHTQCTFAEFLEGIDPELRPICEALRNSIMELHRNCVEIAWKRQGLASYGIGPKKMSQHYAYLSPQKSQVNIGFYRGAFLSDPGNLLEGTGTKSRHVKVKQAAMAESSQLKSLIRQAISERLASRS